MVVTQVDPQLFKMLYHSQLVVISLEALPRHQIIITLSERSVEEAKPEQALLTAGTKENHLIHH